MKLIPLLTLAVSAATLYHVIKLKGFIAMQTQELIDAFNAETNDLATRIEAWKGTLGQLTPEQETEGKAIIGRLHVLASDPSDPVPPVDQPPVEPV